MRLIGPGTLRSRAGRSAPRPAPPSASTLPSCSTVTVRAMLAMNSMSCSTTTSECSPGERDEQLGGAFAFPRRSCRRPARRAAAACGSCISSMPISSHCFWPWDSSPGGAVGARLQADRAEGRGDAVALLAREPGEERRRTRLSAFIASSRFSNTLWLLEDGRLLELAADAGVRDLGLAQAHAGRWSAPKKALPASGRVLPVMTSIIVVLPAPLGPMMQRSSPASIASDNLFSALKPSKLTVMSSRYRMTPCVTSSSGSARPERLARGLRRRRAAPATRPRPRSGPARLSVRGKLAHLRALSRARARVPRQLHRAHDAVAAGTASRR